jgi:EAL domain-containing protein (putative c-di-GMP-specific phosphodiesterase class I)
LGCKRGVVIGVNASRQTEGLAVLSYAERDAQDFHDAITNEVTGTFDPADVGLFLGPSATTTAVKAALRSAALLTLEDDLLLVYFAGHGVVVPSGAGGDAYLATDDLSLDALTLDPDLGLRTGFLSRDVLAQTKGNTLLLLDCCHAGQFIEEPRDAADSQPLRTALNNAFQSNSSRHNALLACPADRTARESASVEHGLFTHHLLRGMKGGAAAANGEVSLDSLAGFIGGVGLEPPVGRFIQSWGDTIVLTRPQLSVGATDIDATAGSALLTVLPLRHPLDDLSETLPPILSALLPRAEQDIPIDADFRLERVRLATGAETVGLIELIEGSFRERLWHPEPPGPITTALLAGITGSEAISSHRLLGNVATSANGQMVVTIKLPHGIGENALVVALVLVNPSPSVLDIGEPLAVILRSYLATQQPFGTLRADLEIGLLTQLRTYFGRVPPVLYDMALKLYCDRVSSLHMVFEPVIALNANPDMLGIHSWEALARSGPGSTSAPGALLDIADVWGARFFVERDVRLAHNAVRGYGDAHATSPYRGDSPKPVGINVAIPSLLDSEYVARLHEILKGSHLPRGAVTLEISEKDPIVSAPGEVWLNPVLSFNQYLLKVASTLHVNFAIDDFGVGYANLDRIANLTLTQIKIDPAILQHELALDELALVVKVAEEGLKRGHFSAPERPIVMEGVEMESAIPLGDIYAAGIQYVQGYIVGEPATSLLAPLNPEARERISSQLVGVSRW